MTVGMAQNRINEMNSIARKLADCIEKINSEENEDKIESLEKYGITKELLCEARQFLSITASNFQNNLNNCVVDCQCW